MDYPDILAEKAEASGEWLRLLKLENVSQVKDIIERYTNIDVPRDHVEIFKHHLLQRDDSWFVDVSDDDNIPLGLIYLTEIIPNFSAKFNAIFWDKKFNAGRRSLCQKTIATSFEEFALTRMQASVPDTNRTLHEVAFPKIGFKKEGVLRNAWRDASRDFDLHIFSLLPDEVKGWQPQTHLQMTTSPE